MAATWFFAPDGQLSDNPPQAIQDGFSEFVSDPANPIPYQKRADLTIRFTPRPYMTDDQRFASARPDLLVFESDILESDVRLVGEINAILQVSTDLCDADWIVKLIDGYPEDEPNDAKTPPGIQLGGYQQMARSEVIRGRFRDSFAEPKPLEPG